MPTNKKFPTGYFERILAIDCETTGLNFNGSDPSIGHQPISWGMVVTDANTLRPIEELYVEIKWNDISKQARKEDSNFGKRAEEIHGLTYGYLEKNGISEEEAVMQIGGMILKYWGPEVCIHTLGHNIHTFDVPFLRAMFLRYNIPLKFGSRHVDTSSIGWATFGTFTSDELFNLIGFDSREKHNALQDVKMAIEAVRQVKTIFKSVLGDK
jgi:DNA polymerase III epsilon subunit-like protein